MTFKCLIRRIRIALLFGLSVTLLGFGLLTFAQDQREEKRDLSVEHRLTTLDVEMKDVVDDIKSLREDVGQIKYYGVGLLIGIAALLGERGLQITGIRLFNKREEPE